MIIPRKAQDCTWCLPKWEAGLLRMTCRQSRLSPGTAGSHRAVPRAAHSGHARATKSQDCCCDRGKRPQEAAVPARNFLSHLHSSSQELCASCTFLPPCSKDNLTPSHVTSSLPLRDDSLALFPGVEVMRLKGQRRRIFKLYSLWPASGW